MNFKSLKDISNKLPLVFYDHELPYSDIILEIYNNDNINPENYNLEDSIILNLIGMYYYYIYNKYELMKKYLLMAIDKKNKYSMHALGYYYNYIEKDYEQMKIYYLMAIDNECLISINSLAIYYHNVEKDYKQMKKYYLMAINKCCSKSMYALGY